MIDTVQWRSSIGSWNSHRLSAKYLQPSAASTTAYTNCCNFLMGVVIIPMILLLMLLLSGDVETNPGPISKLDV